jgi:hypothetical protein
LLADPTVEAASLGVLEDDIGLAVALSDVEAALDVGVTQRLGEIRLAPPTGWQNGLPEDPGMRELDDDLLTRTLVFGAVRIGLGAIREVLEQLVVVDAG